MIRRRTVKDVAKKFGAASSETAAARHFINEGARAERRALRDFLRRELKRYPHAKEKELGAVALGARITLEGVQAWLGGRIERTRKVGGVGRR